jgi:hypothetical protein
MNRYKQKQKQTNKNPQAVSNGTYHIVHNKI